MIKGRSEALLYMDKAMAILESEPISPSICHLQMAIDLLTDECAALGATLAGSEHAAQGLQSPLSANARA